MNTNEAFKAISAAIQADTDNSDDGKKFKALALAALIIAEEALQNFKRIADAIEILSRR